MIKRPLSLLLIGLLCTFVLQQQPVAAQSAAGILQQVNQFRLNNGLPAFQYNGALAQAAQRQASYMAEHGVFSSHVGYGGSTPQSRAAAVGYSGRVTENIVGGTHMTAPRGLTWWINSPMHYRTLISTRHTQAGTGFASDGEVNYYVLLVGAPGESANGAGARAEGDASPEPLFITPITLAEPREDGSIFHVVQEGQALWSLAAHYDVPLSRLLLYNGLQEDDFLQPGDEVIIRLADGAEPPPTPTPPTVHVVREGQSLWSIAALYDVKIGDIMWLNNLTEDTVLRPGDEVKIRLAAGEAPPPTPTPIVKHLVEPGQTLWEVAATYGLTLDQLLAYNGLAADAILHPGDQLLVREPTPSPPPTIAVTPTMAPTEATVSSGALQHEVVPVTPTTETAVSPIPTPTPIPQQDGTWRGALASATAVLSVGLIFLAGVVLAVARRSGV